MDEPEDDISRLWAKQLGLAGTVASRRKKEARGMPGRRKTGRETKSVQLNIKITPTLKRRLEGVARAEGVSISELVEAAFNHYRGNGT